MRCPCGTAIMGIVERYLRNRMKLQIVTDYVGVAGSLFFALQNLSTNWGGNYADDTALETSVKVCWWMAKLCGLLQRAN